jgi:hypothetical protein
MRKGLIATHILRGTTRPAPGLFQSRRRVLMRRACEVRLINREWE